MTNHPRSTRAKFKVGQVVAMFPEFKDERAQYGRVLDTNSGNGRILVRQWDEENGDYDWHYEAKEGNNILDSPSPSQQNGGAK